MFLVTVFGDTVGNILLRSPLGRRHALVDQDDTGVVIEHKMDVAKTADGILAVDPEGGDGGGEIVAVRYGPGGPPLRTVSGRSEAEDEAAWR